MRVDAIEAVYRERHAAFTAALVAVAGDREGARDAVQEGFAIAVAKRAQFRGGSLEAWIWTIAWRQALRTRQREVGSDVLDSEVGEMPIDESSDPELAAAIRALAPRRRLIVFLRYFADLSYAEIASTLDVSEGTVAAALAQAVAALQAELDHEEVR